MLTKNKGAARRFSHIPARCTLCCLSSILKKGMILFRFFLRFAGSAAMTTGFPGAIAAARTAV